MSTLFSPIGTADPLTQLGDGPMLHIVRHYEPDRVVLFLSPEMQDHQDSDGRYTKAIGLLCEAEGREMPEVRLVRSTTEEVWRFDHYIAEFDEVLGALVQEDPGEPLLVNVSSGTPQMEQALVALGAFGRLPLTLLQVTTPRRGPNRPNDRERAKGYDLESMWEWVEALREEDPETRKSRVHVVSMPNFSDMILRENIATLVRNYEYEAALELAEGSGTIDDDTTELIRAARDRLCLNGTLPARVFARSKLAYRPNDLLGEYLSVMKVRLGQGNYADFVRMLSPALAQTCKDVLSRYGLPERKYLHIVDDKGPKLNPIAIQRDERLRRFCDSEIDNWSSGRRLEDWMLVKLVKKYCTDDSTVETIKELRDVEEKCRNKLAHELRASSKESLERLGGLPLETIMAYLFELHGNARPGLYNDISRAIVERL